MLLIAINYLILTISGSFVLLNIQPVCSKGAVERCTGKVTIYYHVVILRLHFTTRECHSSFWLETKLLLKSQWAYSQMETAVVALPLMILCLLNHTSRYKKDEHDCNTLLESTTITELLTSLSTQYRGRGGSRIISEEAVQCFLFTYII